MWGRGSVGREGGETTAVGGGGGSAGAGVEPATSERRSLGGGALRWKLRARSRSARPGGRERQGRKLSSSSSKGKEESVAWWRAAAAAHVQGRSGSVGWDRARRGAWASHAGADGWGGGRVSAARTRPLRQADDESAARLTRSGALEYRASAALLAPPLGRAAAGAGRRDGRQVLALEHGPRERVERLLDVVVAAGRRLRGGREGAPVSPRVPP